MAVVTFRVLSEAAKMFVRAAMTIATFKSELFEATDCFACEFSGGL